MTFKEFMNSRFGIALSEPGTWRGIIGILGGFGIAFTAEETNQLIGVIIGIIGLLNMFLKDDPASPTSIGSKSDEPKKAIEDVLEETRQ